MGIAGQWDQSSAWGADRRFRLQDLMVLARMELSEPHAGSLGTVIYDVDQDFNAGSDTFEAVNPEEYAVNELAFMINFSQVYVARDLYDRGYKFPTSEYREPVHRNMDTVRLSGDFMAIESIFHRCGQYGQPVDESNIKELQSSYSRLGSVSNAYTSHNLFKFYEIRGNMGTTLVSDQLLADDVLDEDDALIVSASDAAKVSIGDFVLNETDGSSARIERIENVSPEKQKLVLSELVGGRTDTFEALDFYSIQSAAQPFECIQLWPKMVWNGEQVYAGDPNKIFVKDYTCPSLLRFRMDTRPDGIHPLKTRLYVALQKDTTPDATEPTWEQVGGGGLAAEFKTGWNEVEIFVEDDLVPKQQYYVVVMTNDFDEDTDTGISFSPCRVELYSLPKSNYLEIEQTRLPIPMLTLDAMCELQPYLIPCVIEYVKVMAYMKIKDMAAPDPGLLAAYEAEIVKSTRFMRKRTETSGANMFRNPSSFGRASGVYAGMVVPPGWTNKILF